MFINKIAVLLLVAASSAAWAQQSYVLQASNWGPAQKSAVASAGGIVTFSHAKSGLGVVTSTNPDFLTRVMATNAFTSAVADTQVRWQPPVQTYDLGQLAVTPGDETFTNLQWNVKAIEAPAAWAAGSTGQGVRVAIVDGGIWDSHPDLAGNIDVAHSASFVPGFPFNQDVGTLWHGTHVAGIIAAGDNGFGTIGVAPNATIIGVKVLHNGSGSFGAVIAGVLYAATPLAEGGAGADIINMSLGALFPRGGGNTGVGQLVASLNKAVNYAGSNGVLVVVAAGNDGVDLDHSASDISVPAMSGSGIALLHAGRSFGFCRGALLGVRHGPQHQPCRLHLGRWNQHGRARGQWRCRLDQGEKPRNLPRRPQE
jgi:subtilisin family serine protease